LRPKLRIGRQMAGLTLWAGAVAQHLTTSAQSQTLCANADHAS